MASLSTTINCMFMVDRNSKPMRFVQVWTSSKTHELVQRQGTVGRIAPVAELPKGAEEPLATFLDQGYELFPDSGWAQVVVQWPMHSFNGTVQDRRLLDRAQEWLECHLDERGLGNVEGHERGRRIGSSGGFVQNMYFNVVDGSLASTAAMTCLRTALLDATRASIAFRQDVESPWNVRYERKSNKLPGNFAL